MQKPPARTTTFTKRLKQARKRAGLTQMQVGVSSGLEEFTAAARLNQYERGVHEPDYETAARIAKALGVPASYLHEPDEVLAEIIRLYAELGTRDRHKLRQAAEVLATRE